LSQPKSRRDGEPKIKICKKKTEFGVATIVIIGNYGKTKKKEDKTRSAENQILGPGVGYA